MKARVAILPLFLFLAACADETTRRTEGSPIEIPALVEADAFSGGNAYAHCARICELGPRPSGSEAYEHQLQYLEEHLQKAGWTATRQKFTLTDGTAMTNLHATFGEAAGARPLLITCHIDTKRLPDFIGADDGASGAAVILELARMLARTPELAAKVEFAFYDGEESFAGRMNLRNSLYGSRYDVAVRQATGTLPRWQINLDMVGGNNKIIAPPVLDSDLELLDHYERATEALGYSEHRWTIHPGTYLDDHTPFVNAGVATLNLIAQFSGSNWWHTSRDTMQRISANSLEESGKFTLQLIQQLLDTK